MLSFYVEGFQGGNSGMVMLNDLNMDKETEVMKLGKTVVCYCCWYISIIVNPDPGCL